MAQTGFLGRVNKDLAKPGSDGPVNCGNGTDTKGKQCMENIQNPQQIWTNICQIHKYALEYAIPALLLLLLLVTKNPDLGWLPIASEDTSCHCSRSQKQCFIMLIQSSLVGEALVICVGHTAWAPEGSKGRSQAGPNARMSYIFRKLWPTAFRFWLGRKKNNIFFTFSIFVHLFF